jgi:hypothetical protein
MRTAPAAAVARELAVIRRAYERAVRAIEAAEPEAGFAAADQLAAGMRELYDGPGGAARVVARAAERLRETRRYSLAQLAEAVNVSKSMAAHWSRRAREGE